MVLSEESWEWKVCGTLHVNLNYMVTQDTTYFRGVRAYFRTHSTHIRMGKGEGNESEGGRRKYTKKGHTKPDGDNELLTECN